MPNPFSITTDSEDDFAVIHLEGAVDAHTAPQFEDAVQKVIDDGKNNIVVDCEKLNLYFVRRFRRFYGLCRGSARRRRRYKNLRLVGKSKTAVRDFRL